jgi:hypothetical protein
MLLKESQGSQDAARRKAVKPISSSKKGKDGKHLSKQSQVPRSSKKVRRSCSGSCGKHLNQFRKSPPVHRHEHEHEVPTTLSVRVLCRDNSCHNSASRVETCDGTGLLQVSTTFLKLSGESQSRHKN